MNTKKIYYLAKRAKRKIQSSLLLYPNNVHCNICGWKGRHFLSSSWHKHIKCPKCGSSIRHRLFIAALENLSRYSSQDILSDKKVLHFAPEDCMSHGIKRKSGHYMTADYLRDDCDLKIDMSNMPEIEDGAFDIVIAFDVLEHVSNYKKALQEVHRILGNDGLGIFTVPQKDDLENTYEDPKITTPDERLKHFGQRDHLRIFGDDFPERVEEVGFSVRTVAAKDLTEDLQQKHVLFPPVISDDPLATNFRKIFFCKST